MDTFTQVILGAVIAEAGFRHRLGNKAVALGAFCGLFPDLDIVVRVAGRWAMLVHHRGLSHSLVFLAAIAPLCGWAGYLWDGRKTKFFTWWHLAFWTLITHPLLDICTSYGTQIFAPFSNRRFALDAISIIDLLYTIPLAVPLIAGSIYKLSPRLRQKIAIGALLLTTGYLALGYCQSQKAKHIACRQLKEMGFVVAKARAMPTLFNIFLWRIVARNERGDLQLGMLSTISPKPIDFHSLTFSKSPLVKRTIKSSKGTTFRWFAMDMLSVRVERDKRGSKVYLYDQRYGLLTKPTTTVFGAVAEYDRAGVLRKFRLLNRPDIQLSQELSRTWHLMWGRK